MFAPQTPFVLPSTAELLVAGGDTRIMLDALSGTTIYGSRPCPDPELIELGSCTASLISVAGFAAADALRLSLLDELRRKPARAVYAAHAERLRSELLAVCGCAPSDGVEAILAASGTDLFLLASQWLRPQRTIMVCSTETGSGVPAAVQGRHFNLRSACGAQLPLGGRVSDWMGELVTLKARADDGSLRASTAVDADFVASVTEAAEAGQRILLVLTDVSKTGIIVPGIDTALALKHRWPGQVEVLVDACQFRLAAATLRAYLSHDCMVAITGSKFMAGPTFCGALMIAPATVARYRHARLSEKLAAYSNAAEWPQGWHAACSLSNGTNFGLLLRWQAAMTQIRHFLMVPEEHILGFISQFANTVQERFGRDTCFELLPVAPLSRTALGGDGGWDAAQTIFPFLVFRQGGASGRRPLTREETRRLYDILREPGTVAPAQRFQLGQPVPCGERDGIPVSALRLCLGAPMLVSACGADGGSATFADVLAALDRISELVETL